MRQRLSLRLFGLVFAGVLLGAPAQASPTLLFDAGTGEVLADRDVFKRWHPASLTKLMTAYVTFRAVAAGELALDSPIKVSKHAAAEPPSKMGFKPGSVMTLDNALKMMLVKSANDIAMAVGENVGGSEEIFVGRMNAEALRLGMNDTRFVNPNGLHDPQQYTTARDLGLLALAIHNEFPQYAPYFSIQGLKAGKQKLMTYNMLIGRFDGADGMKTGFVCASGFNMIGSATRGGKTLVAVVLGETSALKRADAAAALLDQGFATPGLPAAQASTLAALPYYGLRGVGPADMRKQICEKKPPATQSEAGAEHEADAAVSPWLVKLVNPQLVKVALGGATGPIPMAMRDENGQEYADVPIPTPRPDYPEPAAKPSEQGDLGAD